MVFKSVAAADPAAIVTPTFAALLMPVAVRAFAISTAVPVSRVTEVATIVLVVIASSKFKSFALIDKSVTVADAKDAGAPVVLVPKRIAFSWSIVALLSPPAFFMVSVSPAFQPIPFAKLAAVLVTLANTPVNACCASALNGAAIPLSVQLPPFSELPTKLFAATMRAPVVSATALIKLFPASPAPVWQLQKAISISRSATPSNCLRKSAAVIILPPKLIWPGAPCASI